MTTAGSFLDTRPRVRPDVVLGPVLAKGARQVHNLKDQRTGRFLQVGVREFFLISRMDGERTLAEIGADYAAVFRRRLDEQRWRQVLDVLTRQRLLVGTDDPAHAAGPAASARERARGERTPFKAVLPLVNPDAFLGRVEPGLRFLFSRSFVVPTLVAALLVMASALVNIAELTHAARQLQAGPLTVALLVAVSWLSMAAHECAHGLACKHYGGSVPEIGVMWRFPILAPYCEASDVVVLGNRWHRVHTAFAGVFSTMVLTVPLGVLWLVAPAGSDAGALAAAMLLFNVYGALVNLVPVFQLDGYFMLNHALNLQNLRKESYRYLLAAVRGGPAAVRRYPARLAWIYALYGCFSLLAGTAVAGAGAWWLFAALRPWLGAGPSAGVVAGIGGAVLVGACLAHRRRGRRPGTAP